MQINYGIKKLLSVSILYEFFQSIVFPVRSKKWIAENIWRVAKGEKVVDIGCGPGSALKYLPRDILYVGYDISSEYIQSAIKKYKDRENVFFVVGSARKFLQAPDQRFENADLVLCNAVLHHLDDEEVLDVLLLAKRILKPSGRLVIIEPAYLIHQSFLSRIIMNQDRGRNIRKEDEWKRIVSNVFEFFSTHIATNLVNIPYILIFIECCSTPQGLLPALNSSEKAGGFF